MPSSDAPKPAFVLLHSPLLGPSSWAPVAGELRRRGHDVSVPDLRDASTAMPHAPGYIAAATAAVGDRPATLVAHSGAGRLVAAVASATAVVAGIVLVDAGLPGEATHAEGAPPTFREHLAALLASSDGDGRLPPWPEWWPDDLLAGILPDPAARAALAADAPRVPPALFDEVLPDAARHVPPGVPVGYLCFTYEREAAEAERRGWPVERIGGGHLHQLVEPAAVASSIVRLAR